MPATVTLTGTAGAGLDVTAVQFTGVSSFLIDTDKNLITLFKANGETVPPISVAAAATVTATKSGNLWTLTIS
jgi:hypothetical protein